MSKKFEMYVYIFLVCNMFRIYIFQFVIDFPGESVVSEILNVCVVVVMFKATYEVYRSKKSKL